MKAAKGEALPTVEVNGQSGLLGPTPGSAENTFTFVRGHAHPDFSGRQGEGRRCPGGSLLRQNQLQLENLRSRVEFEIRSALLDVKNL